MASFQCCNPYLSKSLQTFQQKYDMNQKALMMLLCNYDTCAKHVTCVVILYSHCVAMKVLSPIYHDSSDVVIWSKFNVRLEKLCNVNRMQLYWSRYKSLNLGLTEKIVACRNKVLRLLNLKNCSCFVGDGMLSEILNVHCELFTCLHF